MPKVRVLIRGIDHESEPLFATWYARHHQVVENAAIPVEKLRVALAPGRERGNVGRHQRLELPRRIRPGQHRLAHMRDIEQPRLLARMQMLRDNPSFVLDRHRIAGERHHARALRHVQLIEGRSGERLSRGDSEIGQSTLRAWRDMGRTARPSVHAPPLSRDLRDFPARGASYPRRWALAFSEAAFQSVIPNAVLMPERFRGGCAFGAGVTPVSSARGLDLTGRP